MFLARGSFNINSILIIGYIAFLLPHCGTDKEEVKSRTTPEEEIESEDLTTNPESPETPGPKVTGLTMSMGATSLPAGALTKWIVKADWDNGTTTTVTNNVSWILDSDFLQVIDQANGTIKAKAEGNTTLKASYGGKMSEVSVEIYSAIMLSLNIQSSQSNLQAGADLQMNAKAYFSDGKYYDFTDLVNWDSDQTGIATVTNTAPGKGLVHGVSVGGPVTITITHVETSTIDTFDITINP